MSISIDDDETIDSVSKLAARLNKSTGEAVKHAVSAELTRLVSADDFDRGMREIHDRFPISEVQSTTAEDDTFRDRLEAFYRSHPMPAPTGLPADKAFFDDMSGELD